MGCIDHPNPDCPKSRSSRIVRGAVGLSKVGAQVVGIPIDQAPKKMVEQRRAICRQCEHATRNPARLDRPSKGLTSMSECKPCGCFIAAKTRLASEVCGLVTVGLPPKWGAFHRK